jgi:hypothetical protein
LRGGAATGFWRDKIREIIDFHVIRLSQALAATGAEPERVWPKRRDFFVETSLSNFAVALSKSWSLFFSEKSVNFSGTGSKVS